LLRIAYLVGSDTHSAIERDELGIDTKGNTDFFRLRTRDPSGYARLHVTPHYFRQPVRYDLGKFDLLLNLVTDADQNPKVLANLVRLVEGFGGRVINPPHRVLRSTRERVARACAPLPKVVAPRTVRIIAAQPRAAGKLVAGFPFPAILRLAGTHTGKVLGLIDDAERALSLLIDGKEHFLTEFRDFRSADGLYRKYRFVFIGDEIVMRHLLVSDVWNVHAADRNRFMRERPALIAEERQAIEYGMQAFPHPVRAGLAAIRGAVGLDMFGVDCALSPEGVILFEANATMNFFPLSGDPIFAYLGTALARAQRAFDALLFGA
jgi:glutathione synthase/RimK-type ligase-like ATP-grasp enzyme